MARSGRRLKQVSIQRAFGFLFIARSSKDKLFRQVKVALASSDAVSNSDSAARRALTRSATTEFNREDPFERFNKKVGMVSLTQASVIIYHLLNADGGEVNGRGTGPFAAVSAALLGVLMGKLEAIRGDLL